MLTVPMTKFNPDFWEVTVSPESWRQFSVKDGLWYEAAADVAARHERAERASVFWPAVRALIDDVLTDRQREVVLLYFIAELNQRQIAERLGITQQSVSEHLYGKVRNGRAVGGALRKLRKACAKRGLSLNG
ncbi:MAG: sigma-70 family RNA polymerase sigma factor [Planctomycetota bacterium]|jgi:DNA-directed RNA polymerase specialized sigma24 family protein